MTTNLLTKQEILAVDDLVMERVEVPEWGGAVMVRGMTGKERDKFESGIVSNKIGGRKTNEVEMNLADVRAKLCAMTICDMAGVKLFTDLEVKDLSKKSAIALQRVFQVARKLSGIGQEDMEELTQGLKENPLEDSASDLQDTSE